MKKIIKKKGIEPSRWWWSGGNVALAFAGCISIFLGSACSGWLHLVATFAGWLLFFWPQHAAVNCYCFLFFLQAAHHCIHKKGINIVKKMGWKPSRCEAIWVAISLMGCICWINFIFFQVKHQMILKFFQLSMQQSRGINIVKLEPSGCEAIWVAISMSGCIWQMNFNFLAQQTAIYCALSPHLPDDS